MLHALQISAGISTQCFAILRVPNFIAFTTPSRRQISAFFCRRPPLGSIEIEEAAIVVLFPSLRRGTTCPIALRNNRP